MTTPPPSDHVPWYIFGIPPLILVLLPVTSSDCDIKKKESKDYGNILMVNINELDRMIEIGSNCLNNESNFFKKHSCDDTKEAAFLNRAARKLKQFLKMNISEDFDIQLLKVSQGTLKLMNCTSKYMFNLWLAESKDVEPVDMKSQCITISQEEKVLKEKKKNDRCFLKKLLQKIKTCWNKILRDINEH